jgi:hypothetical protein
MKLKGNPNARDKNLYLSNNRLYLSKTATAPAGSNEGLFIQNCEKVFIENNKAFMTGTSM